MGRRQKFGTPRKPRPSAPFPEHVNRLGHSQIFDYKKYASKKSGLFAPFPVISRSIESRFKAGSGLSGSSHGLQLSAHNSHSPCQRGNPDPDNLKSRRKAAAGAAKPTAVGESMYRQLRACHSASNNAAIARYTSKRTRLSHSGVQSEVPQLGRQMLTPSEAKVSCVPPAEMRVSSRQLSKRNHACRSGYRSDAAIAREATSGVCGEIFSAGQLETKSAVLNTS